jgi:hypothetical protein
MGRIPIIQNSASSAKDNIVVYLCAPSGELELAPDNRLTQKQLDKIGYKGWRRCEATGSREIEKISIILSRQSFERRKQMKVEQHLREKFALEQLKVRARLRIAQGYSRADEEVNQHILQRAEHSEDMHNAIIAEEFNPGSRNTALEMEVKEQSTSPLAHVGQKRQGIANG